MRGPTRPVSFLVSAFVAATVRGAELPVPCIAGSCGSNAATWVTGGGATAVTSANSLTVNQTTDRAILNWQSFNISKDGNVKFVQPTESSTAVNRIFQADPSRIFGALEANGRVYLINQNGFLFGDGARVNVGGLVASSLDITPEALEGGLAQAARSQRPAFQAVAGSDPGAVEIAQGATINAAGGEVLVFAPQIRNEGTIRTPDGQTILAAGQSVFLATSSDPNLRGLLVEVDVGGTVINGRDSNASQTDATQLVGQIVAERGNVTLAGLAVNQLGRVSATTSVRANGSVRLQARDEGSVIMLGDQLSLVSTHGGTLTVGPRSVTEVNLDSADSATQVDANTQPRSSIAYDGAVVRIQENSRTSATGGNVAVTARNADEGAQGARIAVADGAVIDVSGAAAVLPMDRNVVRVELRGSQLADSPAQRDGALRGKAVFVDVRRSGTREDGSTWQGTPIADVSGDIAAVGKSVLERNLAGGTVRFDSENSVAIGRDALIDISGGSVTYQDGFVRTSKLLSGGRVYDIGDADPNRRYDGITDALTVTHSRWGVTEEFPTFASRGRFERGYVEGRDAGELAIVARNVALDGRVDGSTAVGPHQRRAPSASPGPGLYRPFNQLPLLGRLVLGDAAAGTTTDVPDFRLGDVVIAPGFVLPDLKNEDGAAFDPEEDSFPEDAGPFRLRPDLLGPTSVGRLSIFANGTLSLPADATLSTQGGGEIAFTAGVLQIDGAIDAPGGNIALTSQTTATTPVAETSLTLASTASLTAVGRWVNDSPVANSPGTATAPLLIDGGRVNVTARQGGATLAAGSLIDVSGGTWLTTEGRLNAGRGGSVSITTTPATEAALQVPLVLGSEIRGHSLSRSGELSITAGEICIADTDCSDADPNTLWLSPRLFEDSGFSSYRAATNRGGLSLLPDTALHLRQVNFDLSSGLTQRPSTDGIRSFATLAILDDRRRQPVNLSFTAAITRGAEAFSKQTFADAPGLSIGSGAWIDADPGANVSLRSNSRLLIDGTISAPAGQIGVELTPNLNAAEFLDSRGIWLGDRAALLARGTTLFRPDDRGREVGDVRDGGTVSINASHGYLVTSPDSVIDVSGTAALVDIPNDVAGTTTTRTPIASNGGRIVLSAAEGLFLNGELFGRAGEGPGAHGGELSIGLDGRNRGDPGNPVSIYPLNPRVMRLRDEVAPTIIAPGANVPRDFNGTALVSADQIEAGGFDSLSLSVRELFGRFGGPLELSSLGTIRFEGDTTLDLGRSIMFDAAVLEGVSGTLSLRAPYVALGSTSRQTQSLPGTLSTGTARLAVNAGLIELIGNSAFQGLSAARLESSGDLRLRGIQLRDAAEIRGSLFSSGNLDLVSAQLYPTTLSRFDIEARSEDTSRISVSGGRNGTAPLLSAGGALTLRADEVSQGGVVRAPFGSIDLIGSEVTLEAGSITSTSGANAIAPFGQTQGGFDWVYPLLDDRTLVFGHGPDGLARQRIVLDAPAIDVREGATIDISGGGDLLASEFVPGVGGTQDVLSNLERPNQFAILPSLGLQYAPYDQSEYQGSTLRPGDSIYLAGAQGVPEGTYALLPARYALLPGAMLVTLTDGYQDIVSGQQYQQLDGSTVIAGRLTTAGTPFHDARYSGVSVQSVQSILREAQYTTTHANTFFSEQATREGIAPPRLPRDAGILAINAGSTLALDGTLLTARGENGRGAAVDISGDRLRVTTTTQQAAPGEVLLDAGSLTALGAESLLLGGRRSQTADGLAIDVRAQQVLFDADVELTNPELIAVANDELIVDSGARLAADSSAPVSSDETLLVSGDGALLRVSGGAQTTLQRTGETGAQGTLDIRTDAVLRAPGGSVLLDASRDSSSRGRLEVAGGSLNLSAARISLGDAVGVTEGITLAGSDLAGLDLAELVLTSRSSVDLYGAVSLDVDQLELETATLRGLGGATASVTGNHRIELANRNEVAGSFGADQSGSLVLSAQQVVLGPGTFGIDGFANTSLVGGQHILGNERGELQVNGALHLTTPLLTLSTGAQRVISATGDIAVGASSTSTAPQPDVVGTGGQLTIRGARVAHRGLIDMPAGQVLLEATDSTGSDSVSLEAGSSILLRGLSKTFDGVAVQSVAGELNLSSRGGGIAIAGGALVDVSGAEASGHAGKVTLVAPNGAADVRGTVLATAGAGARGGSFVADAAQISQFNSLNALLNTGGFTAERNFRQRGAGDLIVDSSSGAAIKANRVTLTADEGAISVLGTIDARGASGGQISLNARDSLRIEGGLLAGATQNGGGGGRVSLSSRTGGVWLTNSASIDVSPGAPVDATSTVRPGEISVRVPRSSLTALLDTDPGNDSTAIGGRISGAERVWIEGYQAYANTSGILADADVAAMSGNALFDDAQAFMIDSARYLEALGRANDPAFAVVPGIEIAADDRLELAADWNLFDWRFGGAPGVLTLRAGGDLHFERSLSDGFASLFDFTLPNVSSESWSYRLIAGADASSADVLATRAARDLAAGQGDLTLAPGTFISQDIFTPSDFRMIRTGTGDITLRAAGDLQLGNQVSVIYTAGVSGPGIRLPGDLGGLNLLAYPTGGGDISIDAGGSIIGAPSTQLVTDWLWRVGRPEELPESSPTAWTVNFQRFEQGIGALGGGNMTIEAGGNIENLSVSLPVIGRQVGGTQVQNNRVELAGGGDLSIRTGASILGGTFLVGNGSAYLEAGDRIGRAEEPSPFAPNLAPLLGLIGPGDYTVRARHDLEIETVFNPTLLPQGSSQNAFQFPSYFSTYDPASRIDLSSLSGDVTLLNDVTATSTAFASLGTGEDKDIGLRLYAPSLRASSLSQDVRIQGPMGLFPASGANLELFAERDVIAESPTQVVEILMSDADPALLPTVEVPHPDFLRVRQVFRSAIDPSPDLHASTPVHAGVEDDEPVRVVARTGSILLNTPNPSSGFYLPKRSRFLAAKDIRDLTLVGQNVRPTDITTVSAGRDIFYTVSRNALGTLEQSSRAITLDGAGKLQLYAGRSVDLQTSGGITTRGNIVVPGLADSGASISVLTGIGDNPPALDAFAQAYLRDSKDYDDALIAFVREVLGLPAIGKQEALERFAALPFDQRMAFSEKVLFAELRASGRAAARSANSDFSRGFEALETLFPGSNPDVDAGEQNRYRGDLDLFFSRIYTLDGGDIDLLVPGGEINVGLSTPPAAFGITKSPAELGIVAQSTGTVSSLSFGDFAVNESRVFAADGGNILVWSTRGDIDAGRGAKTAISAPPPITTFDENGILRVTFPAALAGSGIQALATSDGRKPGDVDLFAPRGVVNAGDAGIVAGNLTIAATAVLGADNIKVSGVAVGVPVDSGGLAAGLTGVSNVASSASNAATAVLENGESKKEEAPLADSALSWLDVFVEGFGEETCKPNDAECLLRQQTR